MRKCGEHRNLIAGLTDRYATWYDKKNIQKFADLIDVENNTVIGAAINYYSGPAVLTLQWDIRYFPERDPAWETTAKLKSSISLF